MTESRTQSILEELAREAAARLPHPGALKIQVSGLGETAPPLVFNLLDAEQPGPSARATSRLPEEPPAAPQSEAKVEDLTALFIHFCGVHRSGTKGCPHARRQSCLRRGFGHRDER